MKIGEDNSLSNMNKGGTARRKKIQFSIRKKMVIFIGTAFAVGVFIVGFVISQNAERAIINNLKEALVDTTSTSGNLFDAHIRKWFEFAGGIARSHDLRDPNLDYVEKAKILQLATERDKDGLVFNFVDPNMRLWLADGTSIDVSQDKFLRDANGGRNRVFSPPIKSVVFGKMICIVAVPIHDFDDNFIGCVEVIMDASLFSEDSLPDIELAGNTSDIFIIDENGTYVANKNVNLVTSQVNVLEEGEKEARLADSVKFFRAALEDTKPGFASYKRDGKTFLAGYARYGSN